MLTSLTMMPVDQDVSGPGAVFPSKIPHPPPPPKNPTDTIPGSGISWPAGFLVKTRSGGIFFWIRIQTGDSDIHSTGYDLT